MSRKTGRTHVEYVSYIQSHEWYSKHPVWLKKVSYRCTLFPWIKIGKGHKYACHHMNYKNLGNEHLGRDVIPVSPFAHNFVIHGILSGFKPTGKQRGYPNLAQRLVHFWCVQRLWVKIAMAFVLIWKLSKI